MCFLEISRCLKGQLTLLSHEKKVTIGTILSEMGQLILFFRFIGVSETNNTRCYFILGKQFLGQYCSKWDNIRRLFEI